MTNRSWEEHRVILTGGGGFLGRVIAERLRAKGVRDEKLFIPRRADFDLTNADECARLYREAFGGTPADMVIHAAAKVGGIGANRQHPAQYFHDNLFMGVNLVEQFRRAGLIERGSIYVQVGTICAYPKFTPIPFNEENLWNGYPEETNAPYGIAKKAVGQMLEAYATEYGMKCAHVLPVNLYGPGDHFDLENSHVVPALIRKCVEARDRGDDHIMCWGTGSASREFLYVDDCAEGIVRAAEVMEKPTPINIGAGSEITIRELVTLLARLTEFTGAIRWDTTKPDGQPRRCLDTTRAKQLLGWQAQVGLEDGLRRTIEWYEIHRPTA